MARRKKWEPESQEEEPVKRAGGVLHRIMMALKSRQVQQRDSTRSDGREACLPDA